MHFVRFILITIILQCALLHHATLLAKYQWENINLVSLSHNVLPMIPMVSFGLQLAFVSGAWILQVGRCTRDLVDLCLKSNHIEAMLWDFWRQKIHCISVPCIFSYFFVFSGGGDHIEHCWVGHIVDLSFLVVLLRTKNEVETCRRFCRLYACFRAFLVVIKQNKSEFYNAANPLFYK